MFVLKKVINKVKLLSKTFTYKLMTQKNFQMINDKSHFEADKIPSNFLKDLFCKIGSYLNAIQVI